MPEAPMDENRRAVSRKYEIGATWQSGNVRSVPQPFPEQPLPDRELGFRILAPDAGHHAAANGRRDDIRHREPHLQSR